MPRRLFTTAIAAVVAVLTWIPAPGANAGGLDVRARAGQLDGIDVSKWQEVIDWRKVATTSTRFAIIRATRDHDYVDPTYATNAAGASGAGLVVGAYHYSSPSATPGDARREADLFLATARNRAGDLLPVLDLEDSGGLAPEDLQRWVRGWVVRVGEVLGVRPMIYTSPNFWSGRMRDTTWFADNGYPLWIAHWGVTTP